MVQLLKERKWFFILYGVFACVILFFIFSLEKGEEIIFFGQIRNHFLNQLFRLMSFLVEAWVFIVLAILLVFKDYRYSIQIGSVGLFTVFITRWLKEVFSMPRPLLYFENVNRIADLILVPEYEVLTGYTSFPSGHSTAAFALFFSVALIFKKTWIDIFVVSIAILTAVSRVYLANHFFIDILAGSVLGIIISAGIYVVLDLSPIPKWKPFNPDLKNKV